ncbi:MAG: CRISPR-associated endonuclease Cas6 [Verrucomicrobiota bacterium]|nr:CRISPR-associated endonuclease Cas6 [Verrucomicrobiota bacterium]
MLKQVIIRLKWNESADSARSPVGPHLLRGAIAGAFPDNPLFHQHDKNGKEIYRYPLIQYRWDNPKGNDKSKKMGDGLIVGFAGAVDSLTQLFLSDIKIKLGKREMQNPNISCELRNCEFCINDKLNEYFFRSPWIPLNQEKYKKYKKLSRNKQKNELNRIMIGNILMAARGLNIELKDRVYVMFEEKKQPICKYKDLKLQGFTGKIITNMKLPENIAIGGKISHGYGWIKSVSN